LIPSKEHSIPACYGSWNPTAIKIPIKQLLLEQNFSLCTTEIFGGFQIIVDYNDDELPLVLEALERVDAHLTAAVVSNDVLFQNKVLAHTVNGTTYCGIRARTTGTYTSYTHTYTHLRFTVYDHYLFFSPYHFILSSFSFLLHVNTHIVTHTSVFAICNYTFVRASPLHTLSQKLYSTTHNISHTHPLIHPHPQVNSLSHPISQFLSHTLLPNAHTHIH
jgi:hypothetical protein